MQELVCGVQWNPHILHDISFGESAFVQRTVHDSGVHKPVEQETCNTIERCEKIFECITTTPERTPIVAEKVVCQGNCFSYRACTPVDYLFGVVIEPGISSTGKRLQR